MRVVWIALCAALIAQSQPPDARFEVTSVKVNTLPARNRTFSFECSANGRLRSIGNELRRSVLWAFDLKPYEFIWDAKLSEMLVFDIEADAGRPVTQGLCRQMFQNLLADRFRLVAHREERNVDVYALTVPVRGPKLELAGDSDQVQFVVNGNPMQYFGKERPNGWTMETLASVLSSLTIPMFDRSVIDRTGLVGVYRISLDFEAGFPGIPLPGNRPELFDALPAIGLRLESRKEPTQVLVVDSVQMPDDN